MFIRGFPLYGYLMTVHSFSPVVNYSASSKRVRFFSRYYECETSTSPVLGWLVGIKPHVYQGFPPIWLFNDCLYTYFCQFYRPLLIIPCGVKCFGFAVGTMEVKHQSHQYSDGLSASGPMSIRGFPISGYLMTVSTLMGAFFTARCELLRVE